MGTICYRSVTAVKFHLCFCFRSHVKTKPFDSTDPEFLRLSMESTKSCLFFPLRALFVFIFLQLQAALAALFGNSHFTTAQSLPQPVNYFSQPLWKTERFFTVLCENGDVCDVAAFIVSFAPGFYNNVALKVY